MTPLQHAQMEMRKAQASVAHLRRQLREAERREAHARALVDDLDAERRQPRLPIPGAFGRPDLALEDAL